MRFDYIAEFNGTAETFRTRLDEMIAMKKVELARLEKVRNVVDGIASVEQMLADPAINGDQEPLPSVVRPADLAVEMRNGRPVAPGAAEQEAA
jgi:hypothetical protein